MKNIKYIIIISILLLQHLHGDDYYYKNHKQVSLDKITTISRANSNVEYYKTQNGSVVGVYNALILKLKKIDNLHKYLLDFNITIQSKLGKNIYLLKTKTKNLTINISNRLSEKNDVEYAHPDFIQKRELR